MLLPLPVPRLTAELVCRQVAERLTKSGLEARAPHKVRLRFTEVILDELKCSWQEPPTELGMSHLNNQRLRKRLLIYYTKGHSPRQQQLFRFHALIIP